MKPEILQVCLKTQKDLINYVLPAQAENIWVNIDILIRRRNCVFCTAKVIKKKVLCIRIDRFHFLAKFLAVTYFSNTTALHFLFPYTILYEEY